MSQITKKLSWEPEQIQGKGQNNMAEKWKEQRGKQSSKRFWGNGLRGMGQHGGQWWAVRLGHCLTSLCPTSWDAAPWQTKLNYLAVDVVIPCHLCCLPLFQCSSDSTLKAGHWRFWKVAELMQWKRVSRQESDWVRVTWNCSCISFHSFGQSTHQLVSQFPHLTSLWHRCFFTNIWDVNETYIYIYIHILPPPFLSWFNNLTKIKKIAQFPSEQLDKHVHLAVVSVISDWWQTGGVYCEGQN